jgi:exonuclease III
MKITTWNARGLNAPSKKRLLKNNLKQFEYEIIIIQETKINKEGLKLEKILGNWNIILHELRGASGGLGMIWNPRKVNLNSIQSNNSWMSSRIKSIKNNF